MPGDDHSRRVQRTGPGEGAHEVRTRCHVQKCVRPATARIADAPVLDVPHRHAVRGQRLRQGTAVLDVVLRKPAAAVQQDHHWERTLARRQSQLAELQRVRAVADPLPGGRLGELRQITASRWRGAR